MCLTSFSLGCPKLLGIKARVHITFFILLLVQFLLSLRFIQDFPLFSALVISLYGPILLVTVLLHELGHVWMSRRLLGGNVEGDTEVVLWPLGGYTYCDGLSAMAGAPDASATRGELTTDMKIALAGPLMHVPMCLFWVGMYSAINSGDMSNFTFRMYLTVISNDVTGFFSTLFEQSCLLNILLLWFNIFVPAYPLDGGRLMTSSILLLTGVALNKTALLTCLVTQLVSLALFAWSMASFFDGVGTTGIFTILTALFLAFNCYELYLSILNGQLRNHPLFGRNCYINRVARAPIFQLSTSRTAALVVNEAGDSVANNAVRDDVTHITLATEDAESQTCVRETENARGSNNESAAGPENAEAL